jgi:hypothetical protein
VITCRNQYRRKVNTGRAACQRFVTADAPAENLPRRPAAGFYEAGGFAGDVEVAMAAYVFFFSPVLFEQPEWDTVYKP